MLEFLMIKGLLQRENCFPSPRWSTRPTQLSLAKQLVFATSSRRNVKWFPFFMQYWFFLPEEKSSTINRKTVCIKRVNNFKITKLVENESLESESNYQYQYQSFGSSPKLMEIQVHNCFHHKLNLQCNDYHDHSLLHPIRKDFRLYNMTRHDWAR